MRIKKRIIVITQIFVILTLILVINTSKFDSAAIPLSSVNDKSFPLSAAAADWSNATVISDVYGWNHGNSYYPSVAVDNSSNVHVVWEDWTWGEWGWDIEIMYANYTASGWSNATAISDLYGWNNDDSHAPSVAVDDSGNVHVVWHDHTNGEWGSDSEIMYANYTASGWSNATAISDVYGWNNGWSEWPNVAVDGSGNVHVVWYDNTIGEWGNDYEIMYANYTASGWSNATAISDLYGWNNGSSYYPSVAVDGNGSVHVVWQDYTDGEWGGGISDSEIMYTNYTAAGWSNATVISDDSTGWNNGYSSHPSIAMDGNGSVHVVWADTTDGEWGGGSSDSEIMYANYTAAGWSNATAISDLYGWNNGYSSSPSIAMDGNGSVHVVWDDGTDGEWGADDEIMYANYTASGWSNATVISDLYGWNYGVSEKPSVAVDGSGNVYVVWHDSTDGEWGSDREVMYAILTERPTSNHPADIKTTILGSATIYWTLYDEYDTGQYRILVNDTNDNYYIYHDWKPWINNSLIIIPINSSVSGKFTYTIEFYDYYHQFGISDSVIVTIIDDTPIPDQPESPINVIAPQSGGDISSFLLSPLGLGIIAGFGAILLLLVAVIININKNRKELKKTVQELKKNSEPLTSKKAIKK